MKKPMVKIPPTPKKVRKNRKLISSWSMSPEEELKIDKKAFKDSIDEWIRKIIKQATKVSSSDIKQVKHSIKNKKRN